MDAREKNAFNMERFARGFEKKDSSSGSKGRQQFKKVTSFTDHMTYGHIIKDDQFRNTLRHINCFLVLLFHIIAKIRLPTLFLEIKMSPIWKTESELYKLIGAFLKKTRLLTGIMNSIRKENSKKEGSKQISKRSTSDSSGPAPGSNGPAVLYLPLGNALRK